MHDLHAMIDLNIRDYGQQVLSVQGDPMFHYTVGNSQQGLPELLLLGDINPAAACWVLNHLGQTMRSQGAPLSGDVSLGGEHPVRLVKVSNDRVRNDYTIQAGQYLGREDYEVLQVLLCDKEGRFPGDTGIDRNYDVPVLWSDSAV